MSIFGIDLGTFKTTVSTVVGPGVEIILNSASNRSTPTVVGFGPDRRFFGDLAREKTLNFKNTIGSILRIAGRSVSDPEIKTEQVHITTPLIDVDGEVGVEVTYLKEKRRFTATQLLAMYLTHIRHTIEAAAKTPEAARNVREGSLVVTCPSWFQDSQRRRLQDAILISGWKKATVVNDTAAIAFANGYQLYKNQTLPKVDQVEDEENPPPSSPPYRVAYVDVGHSTFVTYIVEYVKVPTAQLAKLEVTVKSTVSDRNLGGRDFDLAVVEKFCKQFENRFEPGSFRKSVKAQTRLFNAVNKLRTILSVNSAAPLNVECIFEDTDVSGALTREEFDELIQPFTSRVEALLARSLEMSGLSVEDISAVEMIGGTSRTSVVKKVVTDFFKKDLSFTLNMDEVASRGAALIAASISPLVRFVPSAIHDVTQYPIRFVWNKTDDLPDDETELEIYKAGKPYPSSKVITFYRKQDFEFTVEYATPDAGAAAPCVGVKPYIAQYRVTGVKPSAGDEGFLACKIRARLDGNGIFSISEAFSIDENTLEEVPVDEDDQTEGKRKTKKVPKKALLTVTAVTQSLSEEEFSEKALAERQMEETDLAALKYDEFRNEFERSTLRFTNFLSSPAAAAVPDEEKARLRAFLDESEDMLYGSDSPEHRVALQAQYNQLIEQYAKFQAAAPAQVSA